MKRTVERLAERGVVGVPPLAEYKDTNSHRADLAIVDGILPTTGRAGGEPLTMSSREIAQLLGARHDNVKRTINTLANRSAISHPQTEDRVFVDALGQRRSEVVCLLNKRSSLIVVAQLSPEFTARVVDRWQELEAQVTSLRPLRSRHPPEGAASRAFPMTS